MALAPVPVDFHGLPGRLGALCPALQAPSSRPLPGVGTALAGGLRSRRVIQGGIPAQARAHGHPVLHTRRLQGTGTTSIIEPHSSPQQQMTCVSDERTASR
jgi:hypothetical protein